MSNAYSKNYAKMYNISDQNEFSTNLFNNLINYLNNNHIQVRSILDIACGTGVFAINFAKKGIDVSGFDLSEGMIEEAKKNAIKQHIECNFFVGDMTKTITEKKYDLITCNYDAINHLDGLNNWGKFFANVYQMLNEDGLFLFDFNTLKKFEWFLSLSPREEKNAEYTCTQSLKKADDNHIEFIDEFTINNEKEIHTVQEVFYPNDNVLNLVKENNFTITQIFDADFNPITNVDNERRLFVLCKK